MSADFLIEWIEQTRRFSRPQIGVELIKKGHAEPIPLRLEEPTIDPIGVITVTHVKELSNEKVAVLRAELTKEVLKAKDFYDRVEHPVKVEITAVPVDDALREAIGPEKRTCTVGVDVPLPVLHWRGPPFERDDATIEVDADGEHEIELRTWAEHYRPVEGDIGYDPTIVEFTHKTEEGFDPRIFGPHPTDRPWEVAPAGGPNNREHSKWVSKLALPHPDLPGKVPPIYTSIRVQVWSKGAITKRRQDHVDHRREALLLASIPILLRPVALVPELIRPEKPFDADGKEVGAVLRISRQRDGKPLRRGVISWEVKADGSRGTTVRPDQVELLEQDRGETTLWVTPPELTYKPGDRYKDELVVYAGAGADRREIGVLPLLLRPAIKASISVKKQGFDCDQPGTVDLKAISSASHIKGRVTYEAENFDPHETKTLPVCHANVDIDCQGTPVHGELKTDTEGEFTWKLPELDEVFVKLPDEREYELTADSERPVLSMSQEPEDVIGLYNEKLRGYAPLDLLGGSLDNSLRRYGLTFCNQLCREPETSYRKILAGAELLRTGAAGASTWRQLNDQLWARGPAEFSSALGEFFGIVISAVNVGDKLAVGAAAAARRIGHGIEATVRALVPHLIAALEAAQRLWASLAGKLASFAPASVQALFAQVAEKLPLLINELRMSLLSAAGQTTEVIAALLVAAGRTVQAIAEALWAGVLGVASAIANAVGAGLDASSSAVRPAPATVARMLEWLRQHGFPEEKTVTWTYGKFMEMVVQRLMFEFKVAERLTPSAAPDFQLFPSAASASIGYLHDAMVRLDGPAVASPWVDAYTQDTMGLNGDAAALRGRSAFIDETMVWMDVFVLALEAVGMVLVTAFSGGALTAATAAAITQFEVVVGSVKLIGRLLLQLGPTFFLAAGVSSRFWLATASLDGRR